MSAADLVEEARALGAVDTRRSQDLARRALRAAVRERDPESRSQAQRLLGLAAAHQGSPEALRHLRAAARTARSCGASLLEGEARLTLATVLAHTGHPAAAVHEVDAAAALVPDRARVASQRGLVLHLLGRHDEAVRALSEAVNLLRVRQDVTALQTALINRGAAHLSRADAGAAAADLAEVLQRASGLGHSVDAALARTNLAFARTLEGDVPAALAEFAAAEADLRRTGTGVAAPMSMRAELLVSVRLLQEAREAAEAALADFREQGNRVGAADTDLLLAQIHTRAGDRTAGLGYARRARRAFRAQGRTALAALATVWVAACGGRVRRADIVAAADAALASGWRAAEIDARLLAHRLAVAAGGGARDQLALAARWRSRPGPSGVRARAWYAQAVLQCTLGRPGQAQRAALKGLDVLDEHRAALPATDLRAHAAEHRTELVEIGLVLALEARRARDVLRWAEMGRATHLLQAPVRPPDDDTLAERSAALRLVVRQMYDGRSEGMPAAEMEGLRGRQVRLEREIRDLARERGGRHFDPVGRPADVGDLATALGDRALVEYLSVRGELFVVSLVDGRCRLHPLGPLAPVVDLLDRVPFAVQRMVRATARPRGAGAAVTLLDDAGRRLERALLAPLREAAGRDLVVVPTGPLQALPWSVLPGLAGRPVTVAPSATVWLAAARRDTRPGHVVVAAGPRLPGAPGEARTVARIHGAQPLVDPDARVESVCRALPGAALAHLATHGRLSAENPLFSHLLLSDGPLAVYDLERLDGLPHTVVLAACDSGRHVAPAGDELLGLSAAFLARGTAQVVASVVPVPDAETAELMTVLHEQLAAGRPPAVALAEAQTRLRAGGPVAAATAAGFVCIGAGFAPVPLSPVAATAPGRQPVADARGLLSTRSDA